MTTLFAYDDAIAARYPGVRSQAFLHVTGAANGPSPPGCCEAYGAEQRRRRSRGWRRRSPSCPRSSPGGASSPVRGEADPVPERCGGAAAAARQAGRDPHDQLAWSTSATSSRSAPPAVAAVDLVGDRGLLTVRFASGEECSPTSARARPSSRTRRGRLQRRGRCGLRAPLVLAAERARARRARDHDGAR